MTKRNLKPLVVLLLVSVSVVAAQTTDVSIADKEAITAIAFDYMDGALDGDAVRLENAIHPELTKVNVDTLPQTGTSILRKSGYSRLIEVVGAGFAKLPEEQRMIEVEILAVKEGLASVAVTSARFYDYLHIAKLDGDWKIVNVLWKSNAEAASSAAERSSISDAERTALETTARDYLEGSFTGDADRMARALSPELTKVIPVTIPQTGKTMLDKMGSSVLIEGTRAKLGMLDEDEWDISFRVLDYAGDIAMVEVLSSRYFDYLQMAKVDGEWKIVNVLWKMNPNARR